MTKYIRHCQNEQIREMYMLFVLQGLLQPERELPIPTIKSEGGNEASLSF